MGSSISIWGRGSHFLFFLWGVQTLTRSSFSHQIFLVSLAMRIIPKVPFLDFTTLLGSNKPQIIFNLYKVQLKSGTPINLIHWEVLLVGDSRPVCGRLALGPLTCFFLWKEISQHFSPVDLGLGPGPHGSLPYICHWFSQLVQQEMSCTLWKEFCCDIPLSHFFSPQKNFTLTYPWVTFRAHRRSASLAVICSSLPTTSTSEICIKKHAQSK